MPGEVKRRHDNVCGTLSAWNDRMTPQKIAAIAIGVVVTIAAGGSVFMTPNNRVAEVRIGGVETPAPIDWRAVNDRGVIQGEAEPLRTWEGFFWTAALPHPVRRPMFTTDC